jgi:hypothetical protein
MAAAVTIFSDLTGRTSVPPQAAALDGDGPTRNLGIVMRGATDAEATAIARQAATPAPARAKAMPRPIPDAAPVTKARLVDRLGTLLCSVPLAAHPGRARHSRARRYGIAGPKDVSGLSADEPCLLQLRQPVGWEVLTLGKVLVDVGMR